MLKKALAGFGVMLAVVMLIAAITNYGSPRAAAEAEINSEPLEVEPPAANGGFLVEVLINGVPVAEYAARGRRYTCTATGTTFVAFIPFVEVSASYSTVWPSLRLLNPSISTAEKWTNTSSPPLSSAMKPNHF